MKRLLVLSLVIITACSSTPSENDIQTAIAQTQRAQTTVENDNDQQPEPIESPTLRPTSTPKPTSTPRPTNTKELTSPTPTLPGEEEIFAKNFLAVQESGGLRIEIARVLFSRKSVLESQGVDFSEVEAYNDIEVVGEIIFIVQNTTDKILTVYPDQATIVIGDEQFDLWEWSLSSEFGDDFYGEIYPGVKLIGGTWFGVKRSEIPEIKNMVIAIDAPYDEDYDDVGPDFYFDLDLSEHIWEPIPDEIQ